MKTSSSAPKGKEMSEKKGIGAKGGKTKMFGPQDASSAQPSGAASHNGRHSPNNKWGVKAGPSGKMAGPQGAKPASPGGVTVSSSGPQKWGVSGGKGRMFGKQTASQAQSGTSSPKNG